MAKETNTEVVAEVAEVTYVNGDVTGAEVIREGDKYYVVDNGERGEELKIKPYQGREILWLTKNSSNRKYFDKKRADEAIDETGSLVLTYKASVVIGKVGSKTPNAKLISYLSEEDQATYNAIITRAKEAYEAAKAEPMTEVEKLQAKMAKMQARLDALNKAKVAEVTTEGE